MATRKPKAAEPQQPANPGTHITISNCSVMNGGHMNEHTSAAIQALAKAAEANANAIATIAEKIASSKMDAGISVGAL